MFGSIQLYGMSGRHALLVRGTARPCKAAQPVISAHSMTKRMMHSPTVFPGEDAPGTGLRHFPEEDESEHRSLLAAHAKDTKQGHFQFKSSRECYEEFPILIRSGTLLHSSQTPQPDFDMQEGPLSGNRCRPGVTDLDDFKRPRIPGEMQSQDMLLREVTTRRME